MFLAVDVWRGGRGEPEGGEDIELGGGTDWRTVAMLAAAFLANALLIETLGWVVLRGDPVLGCGLRPRQPALRSGTPSSPSSLSIGSWYLFALGLGIVLPPGILDGIL